MYLNNDIDSFKHSFNCWERFSSRHIDKTQADALEIVRETAKKCYQAGQAELLLSRHHSIPRSLVVHASINYSAIYVTLKKSLVEIRNQWVVNKGRSDSHARNTALLHALIAARNISDSQLYVFLTAPGVAVRSNGGWFLEPYGSTSLHDAFVAYRGCMPEQFYSRLKQELQGDKFHFPQLLSYEKLDLGQARSQDFAVQHRWAAAMIDSLPVKNLVQCVKEITGQTRSAYISAGEFTSNTSDALSKDAAGYGLRNTAIATSPDKQTISMDVEVLDSQVSLSASPSSVAKKKSICVPFFAHELLVPDDQNNLPALSPHWFSLNQEALLDKIAQQINKAIRHGILFQVGESIQEGTSIIDQDLWYKKFAAAFVVEVKVDLGAIKQMNEVFVNASRNLFIKRDLKIDGRDIVNITPYSVKSLGIIKGENIYLGKPTREFETAKPSIFLFSDEENNSDIKAHICWDEESTFESLNLSQWLKNTPKPLTVIQTAISLSAQKGQKTLSASCSLEMVNLITAVVRSAYVHKLNDVSMLPHVMVLKDAYEILCQAQRVDEETMRVFRKALNAIKQITEIHAMGWTQNLHLNRSRSPLLDESNMKEDVGQGIAKQWLDKIYMATAQVCFISDDLPNLCEIYKNSFSAPIGKMVAELLVLNFSEIKEIIGHRMALQLILTLNLQNQTSNADNDDFSTLQTISECYAALEQNAEALMATGRLIAVHLVAKYKLNVENIAELVNLIQKRLSN